MTLPKKVLIFGGTHGNEWTGVYAITKYAGELKTSFPELDIHFIHANPEAFKLNRRFKDEDLNRAFQFLNENHTDSYEHLRAREIKNLIEKETCFVLDLHTTTSNMGNTLIISHNEKVNFQIAAELLKNLKDTRIIYSPDTHRKYLASQSHFGMMIEVGPVANGVINSKTLESTLALMKEFLRSVSTLSSLTGGSTEIYEEVEDIFYPENEHGELMAYIHPTFQDKDFTPIAGSYTPFRTFHGEDGEMETKEELYPIFINEAAYYPRKLAFTLCKKRAMTF